jgi:hypothetical protein
MEERTKSRVEVESDFESMSDKQLRSLSRKELIALATAKRELERRNLMRRCTKDPLYYLQNHTRAKDEQDKEHPYKPFPHYDYFEMLYAAWLAEPILLIEKSRTMMLTWFFAGLCLHHAMTNPASKVIFWGPDEDRALQPLDYAWTLWENQVPELQAAWPLDRPRKLQSHTWMELANDSVLVALRGKDPDRIRKEHPTIVFFDEAAIIERFEESYGVALAAVKNCPQFCW